MKVIKNNRGYALLTVLLVFTLLIVVGTLLIGLVIQSRENISVSERNVEYRVEAENAVTEGTAILEYELENLNYNIENHNVDATTIVSSLNTMLNRLKNESNFDLEYKVIKNGQNATRAIQYEIDIISAGNSNKKYRRKIMLSTVADLFKYAVVTPNDITLNGASYLEGDIYIGGDIKTHNRGKFIDGRGRTHEVDTDYSAIEGNLTVRGEYRNYENRRSCVIWVICRDNWGWYEFSPVEENLNKFFSIAPKRIERELRPQEVYFNVKDIINDIKEHSLDSNKGKSNPIDTQTISNNMVLHGDVYIDGNLTIRPNTKLTVIDGNVHVTGKADLSGTLNLENNVTSEDRFIYIEGNTDINNFNLNGIMYTSGMLTSTNDINTNGTIYTKQRVDIRNFKNAGGTLVVMSEADITLANNNLYLGGILDKNGKETEEIKEINAFLYSNTELEIYGVGSNIKIKGGIYGNKITLNAVKGRTEQSSFTNSFTVGDFLGGYTYFENKQLTLPPKSSRLSIIFNKNIIKDPPSGIPTVDKVSFEIVDSRYE